ncbi:hypothetical protein Syun_018939 [Stephania yunnanensis]|uniref:Uncharacterized protein n=1 Tax=Stephania yunnanensis TaxID=152371 RepID=A0AAP0IV45_9MAGN
MEEEGEAIELKPSWTVEEESEPNNLEPSPIVKKGEGGHSGLDIQNEISRSNWEFHGQVLLVRDATSSIEVLQFLF